MFVSCPEGTRFLTPPGLRHLRALALRVILAQTGRFTLSDLKQQKGAKVENIRVFSGHQKRRRIAWTAILASDELSPYGAASSCPLVVKPVLLGTELGDAGDEGSGVEMLRLVEPSMPKLIDFNSRMPFGSFEERYNYFQEIGALDEPENANFYLRSFPL